MVRARLIAVGSSADDLNGSDAMRFLFIFLLTLSVASPARAWSGGVHALICEMAWQQIAPATKQWLREVRAGAHDLQGNFAQSCAWADEARFAEYHDTYEYHFLNLSRGANGFDPARDCPAFDCVPVAVHRYLRYVMNVAASDRERERRAIALRFLAHFVGDLHQPLHAGYGADRGGNTINMRYHGQATNLHGLWDTDLPVAMGYGDARAAYGLMAAQNAADVARWRQGDIKLWVNESFAVAKNAAYPIAADGQLDDAEVARLKPVVALQLQKAAVRLAWLLDEAAAGRFALVPLW